MKRYIARAAALALLPWTLHAAPLKVALLDFEDATGARPDAQLGGAINPRALASKGIDLLSQKLLQQPGFVLIDRRDLVARLVTPTPQEAAAGSPRPGFIQAAQLLGADAVLSGSLSSFSTRKEKQNQAGYSAEFTKLSLRVTLRALDVVDGSVIAVVDGGDEKDFRQTSALQTEVGEEDVLKMMEAALAQSVPKLAKALADRTATAARARVRLNIDTTDNPALVEVDGMLVGTTPMTGVEVYQGDHTLTISRPGYESMSKRLMLDRDFQINVPMLRLNLTAEERKAILEKAELKAYIFNGKPDLLIQELGP